MLLYDMEGRCCGAFGGGVVPEGYWLRPDDASDSMPSVTFLDRLGRDRFSAVWLAAQQDPSLLFEVFRGLAAQNILIAESFPSLKLLESLSVVPAGTAEEIWGSASEWPL